MFNSVLRAVMQKFLGTSLSMWISFRSTDISSKDGRVDLILAILLLGALIWIPIFTRLFFKKNKEQLREPTFK